MAAIPRGQVLIVDDDAGFRALVSGLLGRAGLVTEEAATGEQALAAARRDRPALVLLDVLLPDLAGFEVCRQLRDEFGEDLPVIFISGERAGPLDRAVGLLLGADDYVVKPFDPDEFLARIRRFVAPSRPPRTMAGHDLGLTKRELEVLRLLANGARPGEIASQLVISEKTVGSHLQRVLGKLGVHSRTQAVARAYEAGLMEPPQLAAWDGNGFEAHILSESALLVADGAPDE